MSRRVLAYAANLALVAAQLTSSSLENHVDTLTLSSSFSPVQEAYWTGYPHHRRTPFAVSPDGKTAYLAYLDSSSTGVHVQGVDPTTFAAVGDPVTVAKGQEAGGLVAHNDGFALLTNEVVSGEGGTENHPLAVLYRYTDGKQTFRTLLGGPGIDSGDKLASPDINGDLVYSEKAGYYAAYIVVTSYEGSAAGHFGDAIRYITPAGEIENIAGASSSWGCSHNTGIAFEAADAAPFASICAEDQGAIWLNTETQGMGNNGVKISNEHVINGASNEAMGGMSGSYSGLARFIGENSYIFSWVSRGAIDLTTNEWMGDGYTTSKNRTNNRNVAVAAFSDKKTLIGEQATSTVPSADGDSQVNWITEGDNDCSNAHAATFDGSNALISWEEISNPTCVQDAMGCYGTFAGTKFQMVDSKGAKVGDAITSKDTYVAGDMVTMSDGRICWPYVSMDWSLDATFRGSDVTKMSFACMSSGSGSGNVSSGSSSSSAAPAATKASTTSKAAVASTAPAVAESSAAAVEAVSSAAAIASDAPRPSLVTLSDASSADAFPTSLIPAVSSSAEPVVTSASKAAVSSELPADAPQPTFVTLSSGAVEPLPTEVGTVVASSAAPAVTEAPDATTAAPPAETPASSSARRPGFGNGRGGFGRGNGRGSGRGQKQCSQSQKTETNTVFVTGYPRM